MSTKSASSNQAYLDTLKILERWKTEGVTREESNAFIKVTINGTVNDILRIRY
ncbi:hypothetical protein H1R20_g4778, partial [Candolleomyces eurysporus]